MTASESRFQLLYDTGRLCGYRAATIQSLQAGELTSGELARRAFAHLEACGLCRAEHKTNARRLGRAFHGQIAALLPEPALFGRLPWLHRPWSRAGRHFGTELRDRAAALVGIGGGRAKLTATVATVAVIASGTVGATRALERHPISAHPHTSVAASTKSADPAVTSASAIPRNRRTSPRETPAPAPYARLRLPRDEPNRHGCSGSG